MKFYLQEKQGWLSELNNNIFLEGGLSLCVDGVEQVFNTDIDDDKYYILEVRLKNPKKRGFTKISLGWSATANRFEINNGGFKINNSKVFLARGAEKLIFNLFPGKYFIELWARIVPN